VGAGVEPAAGATVSRRTTGRTLRERQQAQARQRLRERRAEINARHTAERRRRRSERRAARRDRVRALPPHLRRRRRMLRWSALPAVLLLGFALSLLQLGPQYAAARAAYDDDQWWDAIDLFERQDRWALVELWKGPFNEGTALLRADMPRSAVEPLDRALELVPDEHRCLVQTNRALALAGSEKERTERAEEQLEYAQAVADAVAAQEAGEPYDAEVLEPRYEGGDPPVVADELWYAAYLFREAADDAALLAEALADPACVPPPSQGGGEDEEEESEGGGESQDEESEGGGESQDEESEGGGEGDDTEGQGGGQDDGSDGQGGGQDQGSDGQGGGQDQQDQQDQQGAGAAERRMQDLLGASTELENLGRAAEEGTLEGRPELGRGQQQAPDPAQAEAERRRQLADRNGQADGGGTGGQQQAPGGTGSSRGGGPDPGTGSGGGGRNW